MLLKIRDVFKRRTAPKVSEAAPRDRTKPTFPENLDLSKRAKWPAIRGVSSDSGYEFGYRTGQKRFVVRIVDMRKSNLGCSFFSIVRNEVCCCASAKEARRIMRLACPRFVDGKPGWSIGFIRELKS